MPQGFFNSNEGRAFPFAAGTVDLPADGPTSIANLPNAAVVDCGFLIGAHVDYDPGEHSVFLTTITRTGDTFVLVFESDCPTLFGIPLSFVRTIPTAEFATEHTDSGQEYGSLSEAT